MLNAICQFRSLLDGSMFLEHSLHSAYTFPIWCVVRLVDASLLPIGQRHLLIVDAQVNIVRFGVFAVFSVRLRTLFTLAKCYFDQLL